MSGGNPSLQCSVCGQWMRLYGYTREMRSYSRFYGSYETTDGVTHTHDAPVCVRCERQMPGVKPYDHPMIAGSSK